ncbi:MAG TPA: class I SAM-dependent methyltransferase [Chryseosolibacter sp.]
MSKLNRFNWIARSYDRLVNIVFGQTLNNAQMHFMNEIGPTDSVLIIGGGTGKFLRDLLKMKSEIRIVYVEASSEMINLAKQQIGNASNMSFIHGTEENIPAQLFDVVITNFFLDLFTDDKLGKVIKTVSAHLRVGGKWFVSDFEKTGKLSHRILLSLMYLFFHVTGSIDAKRLTDWRPLFESENLILEKQQSVRDGFVSASVFVKMK